MLTGYGHGDLNDDTPKKAKKKSAVKPVSPNDVVKLKRKFIPDVVIETFNEFIAKNYNSQLKEGLSEFFAEDVKKVLIEKLGSNAFDERFLNIHEIFEEQGWEVKCEDWNPKGEGPPELKWFFSRKIHYQTSEEAEYDE